MKQKYDMKYDVRVLERNLREGLITDKQYKEFLKELQDSSENAQTIETSFFTEEEERESDNAVDDTEANESEEQ